MVWRDRRESRKWFGVFLYPDLHIFLKMAKSLVAQNGNQARLEATLDRNAALFGADYVLNLIQVGMYEATLRDFEIPKKYGLKQTIADTLGVGVFSEPCPRLLS